MTDSRPADGNGAKLREAAATLFQEWRQVVIQAYDETEKLTRERPAAGLLGAFLAGFLTGLLVPRK